MKLKCACQSSSGTQFEVFTVFCLFFSTSVSARLLDLRQEATTTKVTASVGMSTVSSASAASDSPSASGTAGSETSAPDRPTLPTASVSSADSSVTPSPTAASSDSTSTTSSIAASNTTATDLSTPGLNSTNDPSRCHKTSEKGAEGVDNIFCTPTPGQRLAANESYEIIWDDSIVAANSTNTIELFYINGTSNGTIPADETDLVYSINAINSQGFVYINMTRDWLHGASSGNFTLFLVSLDAGNASTVHSGPVMTLFDGSTATNSSSSSGGSSASKKLGESVGIPIGLIIFFVAVAGLVFFLVRKRRSGQGYLTNRLQSQQIGGAGAAGRTHRRNESFHDEPTRGVELQDRNRGLTGEDNWDWGSPPPLDGHSTSGTSGNAFREEINRQTTGMAR